MTEPARPAPSGRTTVETLSWLAIAVALVLGVVFAAESIAGWYTVWKTIHVTAAIVWVGGGVGLVLAAILGELQKDTARILQVAGVAQTLEKVFPPLAGIVLAAGIGLVQDAHLGYGTFWITFGLVAWLVSAATGAFVLRPNAVKIGEAAEAYGPDSPETAAAIRRIMVIARFDSALLLLVAVDMVAKPFS